MSIPAADEPVVVERYVSAPPSTVYSLLTKLDRWMAWQQPGATVDPRPGGAFRMNVDGKAWASGHFVELVADRVVVVTWGWESADYPVPPGSSQVRIDLLPDGAGTLVRLTHSGLPHDLRNAHRQGWAFHLAQLESLLL